MDQRCAFGILGSAAGLLGLVTAVMFALGGCAAAPSAGVDPYGAAPADFALELSIVTGDDVTPRPESQLRPSRFILLADGSLHYGEDAQRARASIWMPRLTRILSRQDVAEVWSLAQQAGFTDPARGEEPCTVNLIDIRPHELAYVATFRAQGQRWNFVRIGPADEPGDQAMVNLVRRLAQFAWASDLPPREVMVLPKRYDFGPDPYDRYRQPQP